MTDLKQIISDTIYSICEEDFNDDLVQDALIDMENEDTYDYVNYRTRKYGTDRMNSIETCLPKELVDSTESSDEFYLTVDPKARSVDEVRLRILLGNHSDLILDLEKYADYLYEQANSIYAACEVSKHKYYDLKVKYGELRYFKDDVAKHKLESEYHRISKACNDLKSSNQHKPGWYDEYRQLKHQADALYDKIVNHDYPEYRWIDTPPWPKHNA